MRGTLAILAMALGWLAAAHGQGKAPPAKPAAKAPRGPYYYRPYGGAWYPPGSPVFRPLIQHGNNTRVRVQNAPRLDWSFAVPAAVTAAAPRKLLNDHLSTATTYQLWVPMGYRHNNPHPLILFISAKAVPDEWLAFDAVCRKYGVLFATASGGGDQAHPITRMRLALDVLDDVRRRMTVDTDRIYIAGLSEGARTACDLAFAYPELVGGVLAIGGASSPRGEPYLRDRMRERLSVALVTGELDGARREMEVYRAPVLTGGQVRAKLWTVSKIATAVPPAATLEEVFVWLEAARLARRGLGGITPTLRIAEGTVPTADGWSIGLLAEARARLKNDKFRATGLALLDGVARRYPGTTVGRAAEKELEGHKDAVTVLATRQQAFYQREARALEAYLGGTLPARDQRAKAALVKLAIELWEQVSKHGADTPAGKAAAARLAALRKGQQEN